MKTRLIAKGLLLWTTAFLVIFSICTIDSIYNINVFLPLIILMVDILLVLACFVYITEDEYKVISGYNWITKNAVAHNNRPFAINLVFIV